MWLALIVGGSHTACTVCMHIPAGIPVDSASDEPTPMASEHPVEVDAQ